MNSVRTLPGILIATALAAASVERTAVDAADRKAARLWALQQA